MAAQHEVRAAGLTVASVAADEGYLETDWYDVVARTHRERARRATSITP